MDFAGEVIEVLKVFQTVMGGNLWPLILNDQPQLERERTWTVPQHRRDQAVETIASATIRRCRSTRTNNRSMGEPQGALAIPRAATVYLEHVATLANGPLIVPVREAVAVFSVRRRLLLRLRLRIFAGRSRAPKSYEWHLKPSRSPLRPNPRRAALRQQQPFAHGEAGKTAPVARLTRAQLPRPARPCRGDHWTGDSTARRSSWMSAAKPRSSGAIAASCLAYPSAAGTSPARPLKEINAVRISGLAGWLCTACGATTTAPLTTARRVVRRATPAELTGVSGRPTRACALSIDWVTPLSCGHSTETRTPHTSAAPA